jgi:hypothetical protein
MVNTPLWRVNMNFKKIIEDNLKDDIVPIDTGDLRHSRRVEGDNNIVDVSYNTDYALLLNEVPIIRGHTNRNYKYFYRQVNKDLPAIREALKQAAIRRLKNV